MFDAPPELQRVLRRRPSNAAARFGAQSRLPVLDPRDLLAGLSAQAPSAAGGALLSVRVAVRDSLGGLLRGARELDAPLGLCCPSPLGDRQTPLLFTEALATAAREVEHARPLFLEAGPIRLSEVESADSLAAGVHRCVDAGFTLLSFELGDLELQRAIALMAEVAAPALERDLALEVDCPAGVELSVWLEALRGVRCAPAFLRLSGPTVRAMHEEGTAWLAEALGAYARQAEEFGALLSADEPGVPLDGGLSVLAASGVKKVRVGAAFVRPVVRALPPELRDELATRARARALSLEDLVVLIGERLPPFEPAAQNRIEALCFAEVVDLLGSLGLRHGSRRILDALGARQG